MDRFASVVYNHLLCEEARTDSLNKLAIVPHKSTTGMLIGKALFIWTVEEKR